MYLSRIEIDSANRRKIKDLSHLGAFHNWVENCFPNEMQEGKRLRHLWRIDKLQGKEYLLLLSEEKPDVAMLERYGVIGTVQCKEYTPFLSRLAAKQKARFRLTANPSYRKCAPGQKNGKVYPHITLQQQKEWMQKHAAMAGFSVTEKGFDVVERGYPILYKGNRRVRLSRVTYEGILEIIDLEKFRKALSQGIGREKAYGRGLLTVIPLG